MARGPASERPYMISSDKKPLTILLASPRGFCAGVDRAIQIVERAIERYGRPVYVRHEIVHNRFVVESLEAKGAIFVDELDEVPDDRPVVFSAHGVPKSVPAEAGRRNLLFVDATCPLVSKVHREAERHAQSGRTVILIGHAGHPEVIGTMGQLPDGTVLLVEDVAQAEALAVADPANLAYATQTTLSVDDTTEIVAVLRRRFPAIQGPKMEDICYATTNRQAAVRAIAERCDALVVIGAPNSSNSMRLVEVAANYGCRKSRLVQRAVDMDWAWLEGSWKDGTRRLGITAGASAPELLVDELIEACRERYDVTVEEVRTTEESVVFKLPRALVA
jgi:4-hydroxy-3-methylbut-2-en-1-yl diphosphate reductase